MIHANLESIASRIKFFLQRTRFLNGILPLVIGSLALIWFLIRVIPKPQRASYPCMKVAYPLMSGVVIWILGMTGVLTSVKLFYLNIRRKKYFFATFAFVLLIGFSVFYLLNQSAAIFAKTPVPEPVHLSNAPFGVARGIIPGRVVWSWNPDATNENCTNDVGKNDAYFLDKNCNQKVVDKMVSDALLSLSGKSIGTEAWDAVFRYFNKQKGKNDRGYIDTETVFIKVNYGCANWNTNSDLTRKSNSLGYAETSPQMIISVLKQLVNIAGVPQKKIIVADPMAHIYADNFEILHNAFPDVIYGDKFAAARAYGRTFLSPEATPVLFYSDKGSVLSNTSDCLYSAMQNADYMINISALKAHGCAGITLSAKNHFGSIASKTAGHLHTGLVGSRNDRPYRLDYRMYRVQVDLMGSRYLGRNTLLYIVDGLWGGVEAIETPVKWVMEPFNNDWPNSLFVSLDQVALESVCFDFLRNEATVGSPRWRNRPNMAQGVDDYLHQAASAEFWPEGIAYDPDKSGTPIPSLGIHEHWNNPADKDYSRNLGNPTGIELVKILTGK